MAEPVHMKALVVCVDIDHDANVVARQWVDEFNQCGGFVIQEYKLRKPTDAEVEQVQRQTEEGIEVVKKGGEWFTQATISGKIVTKKVFVIDIRKAERLPMDLEKLKLLKAADKLKNVKGEGKK